MGKTRGISRDDLVNMIALKCSSTVSVSTVSSVLAATYKVILEQLKINETITFQDFGKFNIYERGSGDRIMGDPLNGGTQVRYIRPINKVKFEPATALERNINENNFEIPKKVKKKKAQRISIEQKEKKIKNLIAREAARRKAKITDGDNLALLLNTANENMKKIAEKSNRNSERIDKDGEED